MRTTLDLPDDLLRHVKARAALRGMKLKDYVAEALRAALYYRPADTETGRVAEEEADRLVLGEHCIFPLIRGECGPEMKEITGDRIHQILEDEDVERARGTR